MLELKRLSKSFGARTLFSDLDWMFKRGELTAITGPSGCGKSTLLNSIGLLEEPTRGEIIFDGKNICSFRASSATRFRRDTLGYLFQNYALVENATVAQNLDIALRARSVRGAAAKAAAADALRQVGLKGREREPVSRLSGGEQQRVAVARLLVKRPRVVLADEPTGALDADNGADVVDLLRAMADEGATVIIATHDGTVRDACDEVLELKPT